MHSKALGDRNFHHIESDLMNNPLYPYCLPTVFIHRKASDKSKGSKLWVVFTNPFRFKVFNTKKQALAFMHDVLSEQMVE